MAGLLADIACAWYIEYACNLVLALSCIAELSCILNLITYSSAVHLLAAVLDNALLPSLQVQKLAMITILCM